MIDSDELLVSSSIDDDELLLENYLLESFDSGSPKLKTIRKINLSHNSLSITPNITHLIYLRELHLAYNNLTNVECLSEINYVLDVLDLSNNRISKINNPLKSLNIKLDNNKLTEFTICEFNETISANNNQIYRVHSLKFNVNNNFMLKELYLKNNLIRYIDWIICFISLEKLVLSQNSIIQTNPLNKLINLYYLDLNYNLIKTLIIIDLSNLIILKLKDNFINSVNILQCLKKLNYLNLDGNYKCPVDKLQFIDLLIFNRFRVNIDYGDFCLVDLWGQELSEFEIIMDE